MNVRVHFGQSDDLTLHISLARPDSRAALIAEVDETLWAEYQAAAEAWYGVQEKLSDAMTAASRGHQAGRQPGQ